MDTVHAITDTECFTQPFFRFMAGSDGLIPGAIHKKCIFRHLCNMQSTSQNKTALLLMAVLLPPTLVVITYFILGQIYFASVKNFAVASTVAFLILFGIWIAQGNLARKMMQ